VTGPERLLQVFLDIPKPGRGLLWAADSLLDLAAELPAVRFEKVLPSAEQPEAPATFEVSDGASTLRTTERILVRLFRSLLPRFAVLGAEQMGIEAPLYGGRIVLTRVVGSEPVRLDVDFSNVLGCQRLHITRVPLSHPHAANGAAAHPTSAEPAAG
jgi:hypothetical protein